MKTTECIDNINKRLDGIDKQLSNHIKHLDKRVDKIEQDINTITASQGVVDENIHTIQIDMDWVKKFAEGKISQAYSNEREPDPPQEPEEQIGFMYTWKNLLLPVLLMVIGVVLGIIGTVIQK